MTVAALRSTQVAPPTPLVRLTKELLVIDKSDGYSESFEEVWAPVLELAFDYGGEIVRKDDFVAFRRHHEEERRARFTLESFGVLELDCIHGCEAPITSRAEYVVDLNGDVDALCSFSAYALPQLRRLGWRIEVADDYPVDVVVPSSPWYARVDTEEDKPDWFGLELGVEVDGEHVNLLPSLVDLLETSGGTSLRDMFSRRRKFVGLPLGGKRYLSVPRERLQTLLKVLLEMYDGVDPGEAGWKVQNTRALALDSLDNAFGDGELSWKGCPKGRTRARALTSGPELEGFQEPAKLKATLRPYQRYGVAWLQHLREHGANGILADDMGLGKTLQTIAHIACEKEAGRTDLPSLVIAPTSLVENWRRELRKFAPHITTLVLHGKDRHPLFEQIPVHDVVITSYPILARDLERFCEYDYHYCVLDEAQTIKNPRSRIHQSVTCLESRHRLCLTGTPLENNLGEIWSLFDFLSPGLLGDQLSFRRSFQVPIERDPDSERFQILRNRVAPFILRRDKATVAKDLPPKTELVRPVDLTGTQRDLYESIRVSAHDRVRKAIKQKGIGASTITILDALTKLRQVCCDPRLVASKAARGVEGSAKYEMLFELLDQQLGHGRRALIFSQFTSMLSLIGQGLDQRGINYISLTGSSKNRQQLVDRFERREVDVFLISLKAGGTGLNLTSADTVIHYDPWWNPAAQSQATDRAYRIGQKSPVFVYNLIIKGSVEERMLGLQRHKQELANRILGVSDAQAGFSEDDLDDLFAPLGEE
ncbi:MAG: DEAD/DEAH box helicase [Deltaproteobacteria bacterium]|nr:DEAD/DEAH box helicase [Deltaproteobacteria bacterium]